MSAQEPVASVVIPTHNRAASLRRVLAGLREQEGLADDFEVVVVIDGSTDETATMLAAGDWGLRLVVAEQAQSGVAAARNHGARVATGRVLIFIDDDVAPAPGFIAAHLACLEEGDAVVLGRLLLPPGDRAPGWSRWLAWQLEKHFAAMARGERPVDGRFLYSGNFSLPRELFWRVDGFDEGVKVCEDTDLGVRLQRSGARFALGEAAAGYHGGYHSYESWLRTARRDGEWDAALALKLAYPFGWQELLADFERRHRLVRLFARALLGRRRLFALNLGAMKLVATAAGALGLRRIERAAYGGIYNLVYWHGVCDGLGGAELLRRYLDQRVVLEATG